MNEFKNFHPIVSFIFFLEIIIFSMLIMHPVCLCISVFSAVTYLTVSNKEKISGLIFKVILPIVLLTAIINPIFNHSGSTIIAYFPSGNPLTYESIIYGFAAGGMLAGTICWFLCISKVITSDKITYLFGKAAPVFALIFSMVLRFIPRTRERLKAISSAQKGMRTSEEPRTVWEKIKDGIINISAMVTWVLESSVDTADSMKSRGYGLKGRTSFLIFKIEARDVVLICIIVALGAYITAGIATDSIDFLYFPQIHFSEFAPYSISVFAAYAVLFFLPILTGIIYRKAFKNIDRF